MSVTKNKKKVLPGLIGHFFHTFTEDKTVEWQGQVLAVVEPGYYLVDLFEWILGHYSCSRIVKLDEMETWNFYENEEQMNDHYQNFLSHRKPKSRELAKENGAGVKVDDLVGGAYRL